MVLTLEQRTFATSLGDVVFTGAFEAFSPSRPLCLVVRGAYASADAYAKLPSHIPEADVLLAHLPGHNSPFLTTCSVPAFATAFDEAVSSLGRSPHVMGVSIGGLVAMSMRRAKTVLAVDPPLQTAALWPLLPALQGRAVNPRHPREAEWVRGVFGVTNDRIENIDYRPVVEAVSCPTVVLVAGEPLEPPGGPDPMPGLITAADREWLGKRGDVTVLRAAGAGHNIPEHPEAAPALLALYRSQIR